MYQHWYVRKPTKRVLRFAVCPARHSAELWAVQLHPGNLATHPSCPESLAISVLHADAAGLPHGIWYSALKLACCYLGAANAAAEVVQVVLPQTSILQPLAARRLIPVQWHALLCVLGRPSALAMQAAWLWSNHAFSPLYTFRHSLPAWFSFFQANQPSKQNIKNVEISKS